MGDYVNRERVLDEYRMLEKLTGDSSTVGQAEERLMQSVIRIIYELPSAFNGMTNGEVIQALFPEVKIERDGFLVRCVFIEHEFTTIEDWWDSPYGKGE